MRVSHYMQIILNYFSQKRIWHFMEIVSIGEISNLYFQGKNKKKNIANLSSAELAQRVLNWHTCPEVQFHGYSHFMEN